MSTTLKSGETHCLQKSVSIFLKLFKNAHVLRLNDLQKLYIDAHITMFDLKMGTTVNAAAKRILSHHKRVCSCDHYGINFTLTSNVLCQQKNQM